MHSLLGRLLNKTTKLLTIASMLLLSNSLYAGHHEAGEKMISPPAKVGSLSWMTGAWIGELAPGVFLEENWIKPAAGTIVSAVRMFGEAGTSMVEIVHIEEVGNTLELHIQQWNPLFEERAPAQKMRLAAITQNSVNFTAAEDGGMSELGYSLIDDEFQIHVTPKEGEKLIIKLAAND